MTKTILVTGISGNLGRALIPRLISSKFKIVGCAKTDSKSLYNFPGLTFEKVDLRDLRQTEMLFKKYKFGKVVHLAGVVKRDTVTRAEMHELFDANCISTINVVSNLSRGGVSTIIFASSMAVYGIPKYLPVDENHPLKPLDFYGATKVMSEEIITNFCRRSKLNYFILRFPSVLTREEKSGAVFNFVKNAVLGRDLEVNSASPRPWDVIYIDDAVEAIMSCVIKNSGSGIFNVGYGERIRIEDAARKIIKMSGSKSKIVARKNVKNPYFFFSTKKIESQLKLRFPSLDARLSKYIEEFKL